MAMFRIGPRPKNGAGAVAAVFVLANPAHDALAAAQRIDGKVPGAVKECVRADMTVFGVSVRQSHNTTVKEAAHALAACFDKDLARYDAMYTFGFSRGASALVLSMQLISAAARDRMRVIVLVDLPKSVLTAISLPVRPTIVYTNLTETPTKKHYALKSNYAVAQKFTPASRPRNIDARMTNRKAMLNRMLDGESPRTKKARRPKGVKMS